MSESWEGGSTRAWRRVRARVLALNRAQNAGLCGLQLDCCTGTATVVHHTRGRAVTGDDPRYLQATCAACNLKIGDPTKQADPPNAGITDWG